MKKKQKKIRDKTKGLWAEFKAFINKGNALMLAVGVVLGSGFTAIVNGITNILLNLVTSTVPGGLNGLVTPIYTETAVNNAAAAEIVKEDMVLTASEYLAIDNAALRSLYTNHGGKYYFNGLPVLDWGALINACIAFIFIAVVLFAIVKIVSSATKKNEEIRAKALELYYEKHPEERPAPVEPDAPKPTEVELLTQIRDLLQKEKETKE